MNLSRLETSIAPYRPKAHHNLDINNTILCGITYPIIKSVSQAYTTLCGRFYSHVDLASKAKITPQNSNADNYQILRRYYNKLYIFLLSIKTRFAWRWSHFRKLWYMEVIICIQRLSDSFILYVCVVASIVMTTLCCWYWRYKGHLDMYTLTPDVCK